MKRGLSPRVPSPTPTAFSGISNYQTDSYRPIRDQKVPVVPTLDYRQISKTHFDDLSRYLASYLAKAPPNSRSTARQKLTRLTIQQFHELSTDVYDELIRRQNEKEVPFLPVRQEFHPKRNQARQKLATLPSSRFEDLSSDVYYELARRYPEFKEDPTRASPGSQYDDYPSPDFNPSRSVGPVAITSRSGRTSEDRPIDSGYGGSQASRRPSEDRRRPIDTEYGPGRRSGDTYNSNTRTSEDTYPASISSRRKPSQDIPRKSDERERDFGRRPSQSVSTTSDSTSTTNALSSTATSGIVVPNKSTITEEEIQVPYGRDARESSSTTIDDRDERSRERTDSGRLQEEPESASDYASPQSPLGGLSGLSARLQNVDDDDDGVISGAGGRSGEEYYDKMSFGRTSAASDRSIAAGGSSRTAAGRSSTGVEDPEKLRSDYEYKIAKMQTQITALQRDLGDVDERERERTTAEEKVRQMEEELAGVRRRAEEQSMAMRALQKELNELREGRAREKEQVARRAQEDRDELQKLREQCEALQAERENSQGQADPQALEQLRSDMQGLLTELSDLSHRNDDLMAAKDSDLAVIRDLDNQLKDYKRKYELAKTELRNVKATSQLFLQAPNLDDQLPVSVDGGLPDVHMTAFVSAIDSLLTVGRSNGPTKVLTPMKSVVNAVSTIIEDVRMFEHRPSQDRADVDPDALRSLRDRVEATLSNLVTASKTHATSSGMSPVSLLDAAASHVSATVTEIGRTLRIRKTTKVEQEQFSSFSSSYAPPTNGFSPSLRSVEEVKGSHQRKGSATNSRQNNNISSPQSVSRQPESISAPRSYVDLRHRLPSEPSSAEGSSPPPSFDQLPINSGGIANDESGMADGSEDAWAELKPYLEAQTESIVYAIQSVLSGVRSPTPSPTLNENITQIITIVSSIVAVCNDNLPPASAQQGNDILRELSEHANKLSEVQILSEVTKESRQIMAKSSFAVANAFKGLMKL